MGILQHDELLTLYRAIIDAGLPEVDRVLNGATIGGGADPSRASRPITTLGMIQTEPQDRAVEKQGPSFGPIEAYAAELMHQVSRAYEVAATVRAVVTLWRQGHLDRVISFIWHKGRHDAANRELFERFLDHVEREHEWFALWALAQELVSKSRREEAGLVRDRLRRDVRGCCSEGDPRIQEWADRLRDIP